MEESGYAIPPLYPHINGRVWICYTTPIPPDKWKSLSIPSNLCFPKQWKGLGISSHLYTPPKWNSLGRPSYPCILTKMEQSGQAITSMYPHKNGTVWVGHHIYVSQQIWNGLGRPSHPCIVTKMEQSG